MATREHLRRTSRALGEKPREHVYLPIGYDPFSDKLPHEQHSNNYERDQRIRDAKSDKVILKRKGRAANI